MRNSTLIRCLCLASLLALLPVLWAQDNDAADVPEGVEVLARGPVHEAFAEPANPKTEPSPVVAKQPPAMIEELPPDQKPEGEVQWLPGYWSWDEERNDYIWVSGFWRVPPPGRRWMPGHWKQAPGGWQWVGGFWAGQAQKDITYLPQPPEPIEAGPSVPAPSADHIYVSGGWVYQDTRYIWRPGFWSAPRAGWVWVPSHYVWTPGGYVFVEGYWDFTLRDRGLLFAPAYINVAVIRPGFYYTPTYVIHEEHLVGALFVRRGYGCYYFGDYFEPVYRTSGYSAFFSVSIGGRCRDPLFSYYSFHHRSNPGWAVSLRIGYNDCYRGVRPRPPRTLIQQNTIVRNKTVVRNTVNNVNVINNTTNNVTNNNTTNNVADNQQMLSPLKQAGKKGVAMKTLTPEHRQAERDSAKELTKVSHQRSAMETPSADGRGPSQPRVMKMDLPKGPARNDRPGKAAPPSLEGKQARQNPKGDGPKFKPKGNDPQPKQKGPDPRPKQPGPIQPKGQDFKPKQPGQNPPKDRDPRPKVAPKDREYKPKANPSKGNVTGGSLGGSRSPAPTFQPQPTRPTTFQPRVQPSRGNPAPPRPSRPPERRDNNKEGKKRK